MLLSTFDISADYWLSQVSAHKKQYSSRSVETGYRHSSANSHPPGPLTAQKASAELLDVGRDACSKLHSFGAFRSLFAFPLFSAIDEF